LPYDTQDQFIQVGLAHAIVASGFKVSLILGLVLAGTRRLSQKVQFSIGTAALVIYVGLTGFHPQSYEQRLWGVER
jgi:competence protein ComEC